ncbi:hypothetical protein D9619_011066 [Psilocybe cf. subviscida]|uniref:Uncharacterized protein n=1 Tax=Psilocybe cf. subviscida TaxID=2480587 RepID=A0A8H5B8U7_9AGAR|nr:hypothetical protein D9619_011066 [Psilocybe cf. subviscida]
MQFAKLLAFVAFVAGSAYASAVTPAGCVVIDGVSFCNIEHTAFVVGPDGCVVIDGPKQPYVEHEIK